MSEPLVNFSSLKTWNQLAFALLQMHIGHALEHVFGSRRGQGNTNLTRTPRSELASLNWQEMENLNGSGSEASHGLDDLLICSSYF
jgi:hypothetical protein